MTHFKNIFKNIMTTGAIAVSGAFVASGADALGVPLSGTFNVEIRQADNTGNPTGADATFAKAFAAGLIGTATYTGDFGFRTTNSDDSTTIDDWLTSAGGSYTEDGSGFDEGLTISNPSITATPPTALTTWFVFTGNGPAGLYDFVHDDGIQFCGDALSSNACPTGSLLVNKPDPTTEALAGPVEFGGGDFSLVYAATNGDPSILEVNVVPLPAAAWLLLGVSGALVAAKRRSARRAA